ncbi:MAG: hypothetical protein ACRD26_12415 [Vicinamibacterales bacterium]
MTNLLAVQLIGAVLLLAGGVVLWARGGEIDRLAGAQRALVTLQYSRAEEAPATRAAARYWNGDYASVPAGLDPLLAANAAYRAAVAPGGTAKEMVTRLDGVVTRYAEVLRDDPANDDAAFNYEFVVRYRAAIAARGVPIPPATEEGDLTPHGRVGAPPQGTDQKQFRMLVPMRPDERREAEEAGKAGRRMRKG